MSARHGSAQRPAGRGRPQGGRGDRPPHKPHSPHKPRTPERVALSAGEVPALHLRAGHVRPLWAGHPWLFAQGVERVAGEPRDGDEVRIIDAEGKPIARALYSEGSAIVARVFSLNADEPFSEGLVAARLRAAVALRAAEGLPCAAAGAETTGYRLLHSEGDGLPGLIVDRLGDTLSAQWLTEGVRRRRELITAVLLRETGAARVVERGQGEGEVIEFMERGLRYSLPPDVTQKTGYYFDQRPLREWVERAAAGRRVFDGHAFVGSMSLAAARGGARSVLTVESSAPAAAAAAAHAALNGLGHLITVEREDVRVSLAAEGREGAFDLVLLDPPPYAQRREHLDHALKGYAKLVELGARALAPGGLLVLSSCSAAVDLDALQRSLALGAAAAGRRAVVTERLFQGADHPVPAAFPEGLYLRTLVARL